MEHILSIYYLYMEHICPAFHGNTDIQADIRADIGATDIGARFIADIWVKRMIRHGYP